MNHTTNTTNTEAVTPETVEAQLQAAVAKLVALEEQAELLRDRQSDNESKAHSLPRPIDVETSPRYDAQALDRYGERKTAFERAAMEAELAIRRLEPALRRWRDTVQTLRLVLSTAESVAARQRESEEVAALLAETLETIRQKGAERQAQEVRYRQAVESSNVTAAAHCRMKLLVFDDIQECLKEREATARRRRQELQEALQRAQQARQEALRRYRELDLSELEAVHAAPA